jgi:hypothetical protein
MDLHAELVEFLKYADVEGKKLTWNLQVNASTVTVKFIWIKDENSIMRSALCGPLLLLKYFTGPCFLVVTTLLVSLSCVIYLFVMILSLCICVYF